MSNRILIVLSFLVMASCRVAQIPTQEPSTPALAIPKTTGSGSVRITLTSPKGPIKGHLVAVPGDYSINRHERVSSTLGSIEVLISEVPSGATQLVFLSRGPHASMINNVNVSDKHESAVTLLLKPASDACGRVVDLDQNPIEDVRVEIAIYNLKPSPKQPVGPVNVISISGMSMTMRGRISKSLGRISIRTDGAIVFSTKTNKYGGFAFEGVPESSAHVTLKHPRSDSVTHVRKVPMDAVFVLQLKE